MFIIMFYNTKSCYFNESVYYFIILFTMINKIIKILHDCKCYFYKKINFVFLNIFQLIRY